MEMAVDKPSLTAIMVHWRRWIICAFIVTVSVTFLYWTDGTQKWYLERAPCENPHYQDLVELAFRIHEILDKLVIPHFLCYGTLWGAVRTGEILPWDNNVDICVLDEDISRVDEAFLHTTFRRASINGDYESRHGRYRLRYKHVLGFITVFRRHLNQMYRIGWQMRLYPFMFRHKDIFPARLVEQPLANDTFHGSPFPVPREHYAILKYLYVDDWWHFMKPLGC